MFNPTTIKTNFSGLLGFRNSRDPDLKNLTSALTASASGLYFDDIHPMITIDNLDALAPGFSGMAYSAYSAVATYAKDAKVTYVNRLWVSLTGSNTAHTPGTNATYWKLELNNWLDERVGAASVKVLDAVFSGKKLTSTQKGFFENLNIFDGRARYSDIITKSSRRVGFEVRLKRNENIKAVLNQIGGMFSGVQTSLTVDVHHPGKYAPVATYAMTGNTINTFSWVSAGRDLPFSDYTNNYDSGGVWYISYLEDSLVGNAILKRYNFNGGLCDSCDGYNSSAYKLWNKYFDIRPFEVQAADVNGANMWDVDKMGYTYDSNFGLNLALSVQPDLTQLISQEKKLFARAVGLQFAVDTLTMLRYNANARSNAKVNIPRNEDIVYDLEGLEGNSGLKKELDNQIKGLQNDFSGLGEALPSQGRQLSWRAL